MICSALNFISLLGILAEEYYIRRKSSKQENATKTN
jgi:hypothetical protein